MVDNYSDDFDNELEAPPPPGDGKDKDKSKAAAAYIPPGSRTGFSAEYPDAGDVEVEEEGVSVGAPKAKNIMVIGVAILVGLYFIYKFTFSGDSNKNEDAPEIVSEKIKVEKPPSQGEVDENIGVVKAPELPEFSSIFSEDDDEIGALPAVSAPAVEESDNLFQGIFLDDDAQVDAPEFEAEEPTELEIFKPQRVELVDNDLPQETDTSAEDAAKKRQQEEQDEKARQKMLRDFYDQPLVSEYNGAVPTKPVNSNGFVEPKRTKSMQIAATNIGNANLVIAQGRMIEAILESAVNTDIPGYVRAVVSRDVYSETGRNILIPKGSRLVGDYGSMNNFMRQDVNRLAIGWTRIILPNGMDIDIASQDTSFPATDQLGRAGVHALVDRKYLELFSTSALLSVLTVGGAIIAEKISDEESPDTTSTTTGADGSITTTSNRSASDEAILSAVNRMGQSVGGAIDGAFGKSPTMIVGQGTRVRVYVRNDIVFPKGDLRYID